MASISIARHLRYERTKAVHHVANLVVRDRVVCRRTAVIEIPFRRIFKANDGRDADWQLLKVERERPAPYHTKKPLHTYIRKIIRTDYCTDHPMD